MPKRSNQYLGGEPVRKTTSAGKFLSPRVSKIRWKSEKPDKMPCTIYRVDPEALATGKVELPKPILNSQPQSIPQQPAPVIEVHITITPPPQTQPEPQQSIAYPAKSYAEMAVSDAIALKLNGKREVHCPPVGRIDILTDLEIIEVKEAGGWKHALGQITVYGYYHPTKRKVIYLFGECADAVYAIAIDHCTRLGIELRIYDQN